MLKNVYDIREKRRCYLVSTRVLDQSTPTLFFIFQWAHLRPPSSTISSSSSRPGPSFNGESVSTTTIILLDLLDTTTTGGSSSSLWTPLLFPDFNVGLFDYLIAIDDSELKDKKQGNEGSNAKKKNSKRNTGQKLDTEFGVVRAIDFKNVYTRKKIFACMVSQVSNGRSIYLPKRCLQSFLNLPWELTLPVTGCKRKIGCLWLLSTVMRGYWLWPTTLVLGLDLTRPPGNAACSRDSLLCIKCGNSFQSTHIQNSVLFSTGNPI